MPEERKGVVTLKGNPVTLGGPEIKPGQAAPDFTAVDNGLKPVTLAEGRGKVLILSSVPSLDTPTCDTETRRFNQEVGKLTGVEVWTISMDLPFAQKRWCAAAGASAVKTLSDFRERAFGPAYGCRSRTPLAGLERAPCSWWARTARSRTSSTSRRSPASRTTRRRCRRRRRPPASHVVRWTSSTSSS